MSTRQTLVKAKVWETIAKAQEVYGSQMPRPRITFSNRMTKCAGMHKHRPHAGTHELAFSNPIMENNDIVAFCEDTVVHEVAHMVDTFVNGSTGHNQRFYNVMRKLGHKNPTRCHTFKVVSNRKTFPYRCESCGEIFQLGAVRHKKMQNYTANYRHTKCANGKRLVYIGY